MIHSLNLNVVLRKLFKIIFYCALACILLFLWTITGGQAAPVEFQDAGLRNQFYLILFIGTLLAIPCTLFGTIRKNHSRLGNFFIIVGTCLLAVGCFNLMVSDLFKAGRGVWSTFNIVYEKRGNPAIQIREQEHRVPYFGFDGDRVVEVSPALWVFWRITPVDLDTVDSTQWIRLNKRTM